MTQETLKWKLFPFSLMGRAKQWYTHVVESMNGDCDELKDKSRPACINAKNLAQAAPIDSSYCSKSRIALGRESIQDIGKNAR